MAMTPETRKKVMDALLMAGGGAFGAVAGRKVMPEVFGYSDDPSAVNTGTMLNSVAGILAMHPKTRAYVKSHPAALFTAAPAIAAEEMIPVAHRAVNRIPDTMERVNQTSGLNKVLSLASSGTAKGAVAGTAAAGLAAILTGLAREKTEREFAQGTDRGGMVLNDFLSYAAPGAIGGGVLGAMNS